MTVHFVTAAGDHYSVTVSDALPIPDGVRHARTMLRAYLVRLGPLPAGIEAGALTWDRERPEGEVAAHPHV